MRGSRSVLTILVVIMSLLFLFPAVQSWGYHGHLITCRIAQALLSTTAANAVKKLLPAYAANDLGRLCSWADKVRFRYRWSSPLHFINTPDDLCTYRYKRDCKDKNGVKGRCVAGAINNYTSQLLSHANADSHYNQTEALLFLSHFIGDIHQPLHVAFASDKGGTTIGVNWFQRKDNLHHVWDTSIIQTQEKRFYSSNVGQVIDTIRHSIKTKWADQVKEWQICRNNSTTCPGLYASESANAACRWAYKGVKKGSVLKDDYFQSRLQIVNLRLAQGGVRLAATLNRIFK